jgi:tetratricopeptide (TPR) repeat protein
LLLTQLGRALYARQRIPEAEKALREAHRLLGPPAGRAGRRPVEVFDLAHTAAVLGDLLLLTGRPREAEGFLAETVRLMEALRAGAYSRVAQRRALAGAYHDLGSVWARLSREPEAEQAYRKALEGFGKLAADYPALHEYRLGEAKAGLNLGGLLVRRGREAEAEPALRHARALLERLLRQSPKNSRYREHLATVLINLGPVLRKKGQDPEADQLYGQALALLGPLVAEQPERFELALGLALVQAHRGALLKSLKREPEGEQAYRQALALESQLAPRAAAAVPEYKALWIKFTFELGAMAYFRGELKEARRLHEEARRRLLALAPGERGGNYAAQLQASSEMLVRVLLRLRDHREAARQALEMPRHSPLDVRAYAQAGGCFAACALQAAEDERLPPEERQALARSYVEQGARLIREVLRKRGPNGDGLRAAVLKTLQQMHRADALRAYPEWQKLLQELGEASPR